MQQNGIVSFGFSFSLPIVKLVTYLWNEYFENKIKFDGLK